jgi:hypothetical protein
MRRLVALLFLPAVLYADSPPILQGRLIVLDPGHATLSYEQAVINPGKTGRNGAKESRVAMKVAQKLGELLEKEGANVYFTRTEHDFWRESYNVAEDNKARAAFANKVGAHAYLSIHCDWDPRSRVHGVTTFYAKDNSRRLGAEIQKNMVKELGAKNRQLVRDTYTVLDVADMPRDTPPATPPEALAKLIHDPLNFVRVAFAWGEGDLAGESGPDEWQTDHLAELGRMSASGEPIRMATASGHGVGKSADVAWVTLWALLTRPNLVGAITANTQNQLSGKTWAELARWYKRLHFQKNLFPVVKPLESKEKKQPASFSMKWLTCGLEIW